MLEYIEIVHIKGIENRKILLNIYPNKPSVLVAPNGFGKTSIATAFSSFNNNRLMLNEKTFFNKQEYNDSRLTLSDKDGSYEVNNKSNTLSKNFDTLVINSSIYAKPKSKNMGSFMAQQASLGIKEIVLEKQIPNNIKLPYAISNIRTQFGTNGKILKNIASLINDSKFIVATEKYFFSLKSSYLNKVTKIKEVINSYSGTPSDIILRIEKELLHQFENISELKKLKELVAKFLGFSDVDCYLGAIQVVEMFNDKNFKHYLRLCEYKERKKLLNEQLKQFNTTKNKIISKEKTISSKKSLVLEFPDAEEISNGERDILYFIANLYKVRKELNKSKNILLIDEIFDYLDDVNLITFQYYITKLIEEYKKSDKQLYCLLLTHLDPEYFKHFCFSKHKLQIKYLMSTRKTCDEKILNLMKKRKSGTNKDIDKYLFHYHIDCKEIESINNTKWYTELFQEVTTKYLTEDEYDVMKVCLAIRIKIEENAYNLLRSEEDRKDFLNEHGTNNKLLILSDKNYDYPEIYSLLGIVYNSNLHWYENKDYYTPLKSKLDNLVIKNMISTVFQEALHI